MIETRICVFYIIIGAILYVLGYICGSEDRDDNREDMNDESTL